MFFGLGHPMLDISTRVTTEFLQRFNLKANSVVLAQNLPQYDEISKEILNNNYQLNYTPGGSTQNTLKTIRWFLGQDNLTVCMGCIGQDESGERLKQQMDYCLYQQSSKSPTATCLILITDQARSMITNIGAANDFTIDYLIDPHNWIFVEQARFFYVPGYFIRTCFDGVRQLAEYAAKTNKIFAFNLSAEYICQNFTEEILSLLPFVDFLFANDQEIKCFAQKIIGHSNNDDIVLMSKELRKLLTKNSDTCLIVTQSANPVILISYNDEKLFSVKSPPYIIDTIGCGDAFVGGFLAYHSLNYSLDDCINAACYCAYECLLQTECQFSNKPSFDSTQKFCHFISSSSH